MIINNLKEKVEQEIVNINNSYDTVFNNVSKSFELKHEKLYQEEKDLIETLQNEVTKIKEKLEITLSECNDLIRFIEKLDRGIKKLENSNNEENKIKKMSYISEMNKNKKKMNILNNILIKNMKIKFDEQNKRILFDYYYFNGIPSPTDIEIKNIQHLSFEVNWKFDYKSFDLDKNEIKFILEIKKENGNFLKFMKEIKKFILLKDYYQIQIMK